MNANMKLVEKISNYFLSETDTELEKAMFIYGLQIIIHDMSMVILILITAYLTGIFWKSVIVFSAFGLLRVFSGGFHFQKSWQCLLCTGGIVVGGAYIAQYIEVFGKDTVCIYMIIMVYMWYMAPKSTKNNPLDDKYYIPFKKTTVRILIVYLILGICVREINSYLLIPSICQAFLLLIKC